MAQKIPYIEKELSWLAFNERVLQEAKDKHNPLIERVRFLGIYSSNLEEFYKVRIANLKRTLFIENEENRPSASTTLQILKKVSARIQKTNVIFDHLYNELLLEMARNNIFLVNERQLSDSQETWLRLYFQKNIRQHIFPIVITSKTDLIGTIKEENTYLAIEIINGQTTHYALLNIPSEKVSRFISLPSNKGKRYNSLILLDNILRFCLSDIFNTCFTFTEINAYSMKITRDAEYDLIMELDASFLEMMSLSLKQRLTAEPVRFLHQKEMPRDLVKLLMQKLSISSLDVTVPSSRYQNFSDLVNFPSLGAPHLNGKKYKKLYSYALSKNRNNFEAIAQNDILLYYPYYSFDHILNLLQQAAFDPAVTTITINIYRVARNSRILNSMINAAANGKKVTVVIELQARFDEASNIKWSQKLTDAGVKVIFSPPGIKIHAKLFLITRVENGELIRYANIGTGNFNEKTAEIYTDISLLTVNPAITEDVHRVFRFIENPYLPVSFEHLLVSPQNMRQRLNKLIEREINYASKKLPASIDLKLNNLVDEQLIDQLYLASQAGVKIRLLVRGMCSLVAKQKGFSENITVTSIIDNYLEHARVYVFGNNGESDVYISSADWMTRNMDRRIDVGVKILDTTIKKRILDTLEMQFNDNVKARIVDKELNNMYVKNDNPKLRSQHMIYHYFNQIEKHLRENNA